MSTQKKVLDIIGKEQVEFIAAQQAIKLAEVLRVVVIDSGFGGLSVCREIEREATKNACGASIQIIYMNAAVQVGLGYNNLKCYDDKITLFNETLLKTTRFKPDIIMVACNTLSVLLFDTPFMSYQHPPVISIVGFGTKIALDNLKHSGKATAIVFGTETTITSQAHKSVLINGGFSDENVICTPCPNLQQMIEREKDKKLYSYIFKFVKTAVEYKNIQNCELPILALLCCTHYGYKDKLFLEAFRELGLDGRVKIIDPNKSMAQWLIREQRANRTIDKLNLNIEIYSRYNVTAITLQTLVDLLGSNSLIAHTLNTIQLDKNLFEKRVLASDVYNPVNIK